MLRTSHMTRWTMLAVMFTSSAALAQFPGQIIVNPDNPRWLIRQGGTPLFLAGPGDPEGFLYRGKRASNGTRRGDQEELIEKLGRSGANCIYLVAIRSHGGDGGSRENPFNDPTDPTSGLNESLLDQWETWFAAMDRHGIVIFFIFYDDNARPFDRSTFPKAERTLVADLVNHFEDHKNLIWCVAEEAEEGLTPRKIKQIAATIDEADNNHHPIAVHFNNGLDRFGAYADDPHIDQFAIQYNDKNAAALHRGMAKAFGRAGGKYNLNMVESKWHLLDPETRKVNRRLARRKSWATAMGGAYVMALGMDITQTPKEVLADHGRIVRFFEQTRFQKMVPSASLAIGQTDYVLAEPGRSYILYSDDAVKSLGIRDLEAGTYRLYWFDPADGDEVRNVVTLPNGLRAFTKPPEIGSEAVLYILRTD